MWEIKFRGKCADDNEWTFGYLFDDGMIGSNRKFVGGIVIEDYKGNADDRFDITGIDFCEVIPDTVCQYTEIDDKNGTNIFHKDIVSAPFIGYGGKKHTRIGVVEYVKGAFCVNWNDSEEYGKNFLGYVNDVEVIGNIFDNPELLKEDTENANTAN